MKQPGGTPTSLGPMGGGTTGPGGYGATNTGPGIATTMGMDMSGGVGASNGGAPPQTATPGTVAGAAARRPQNVRPPVVTATGQAPPMINPQMNTALMNYPGMARGRGMMPTGMNMTTLPNVPHNMPPNMNMTNLQGMMPVMGYPPQMYPQMFMNRGPPMNPHMMMGVNPNPQAPQMQLQPQLQQQQQQQQQQQPPPQQQSQQAKQQQQQQAKKK